MPPLHTKPTPSKIVQASESVRDHGAKTIEQEGSKPTTPLKDRGDLRPTLIVSGTRGFPCVYREPGSSPSTIVASWFGADRSDLDGFLVLGAHDPNKNS